MNRLEITRRDLLKSLGGGMLLLVLGPATALQRGGGQPQVPTTVSAWLHVGTDGRIKVFSGKVEVGQNVRTSLAQAVAEELRVPFESVEMVLGDTDLCPFDQGTFGSRSTPAMSPQLRRAAASAREALVEAASKKLGRPASELRAENGRVFAGSESFGYGELASSVPSDLRIAEGISLTPAESWKVMGKAVPKTAGRAIVAGEHQYTVDQIRPGMLHAKVLRPPSLGAELASVSTAAAEALPGVKVFRDAGFVAVSAPSQRLAQKALDAVEAKWTEKGGISHKDLHERMRPKGQAQPSLQAAAGDLTISARFTCPYIAHVPLEPRAALAEWDGSRMTVHTGTQRPFGVRGEVARALELPESQVRVIVPDTGSGYGGKHSGDAAVEAARIAKALGVPVKLVWTRAEEFMFAYFRPAGVVEIAASVRQDGTLGRWEFDNYNSGGAGIASPYRHESPRTQARQAESPLRQGSYRALASTFNNFARETAMDELAALCKVDPLEFRLKNLESGRLKAVLQAAADKFGWGSRKPEADRAFGLACGTEKGGFVATCVEVQASKATGQIRVIRAVTAFECGAIVNPAHCESQVVGSVLQGLGGALFEAIEFENGRLLNGSLSKYRVPRFSDIPEVETVLLDRKDLPSAGAGEAAIITIAPAIGNAVFAGTGVRLRDLPLKLS